MTPFEDITGVVVLCMIYSVHAEAYRPASQLHHVVCSHHITYNHLNGLAHIHDNAHRKTSSN